MKYDLEDRTKNFSKNIIILLREIRKDEINRNLISQLIRSATSIGANYCEANNASSNKDFKNKIFICRKEIQETKYWIEIMAQSNPEEKDKLRKLWLEAHEFALIFNKISSTMKQNQKADN
ncbi:four helix bundle protein [Patescibacteria group bacterium]|nr:four helix bundle protein [Patescibacteria group bacterium]MBU2580077.1 four helix bundle protein [Patescibacteria group bacterium]MBU4082876.1 four helix bundle protein [Patescibacteria group bacterium]